MNSGHVDEWRIGPIGMCTVSKSLKFDGVAVVMTLDVIKHL